MEGHKSIQYVQGSETVKLKKDLRVKVNCYGCCSVTQSCPTLCDSVNWSMPGLPVLHHLPELSETHVHWIGDAIQPSYPLSSPFPPAFRTVMVKLVLTFCPDGLSPDWKQLETEFWDEEAEVTFIRVISWAGIVSAWSWSSHCRSVWMKTEPQTKVTAQ